MLFFRHCLKSFLFPFCSLPDVDEMLCCEVRIKEQPGTRAAVAGGLLVLSGSTVKRERGAPKTKAHTCKACCTGSESEITVAVLHRDNTKHLCTFNCF